MKKAYSKPEILFESFVANVNIAACEVDLNNPTTSSCFIGYGTDMRLFIGGACNVIITEANEGEYNVCYHNPTELGRIFGS